VDFLLNVNDLKQYVYCPRIVYYTWVMPVGPPPTFLMERGHKLEEEFGRLEPRRVLGRFGFEEAARHFGLAVTDAGLGLTGVVDLALQGRDRAAAVEFKATASALAENHRVQACAYSLLLEKHFGLPCPRAFVILKDRAELAVIDLDDNLRRQTLNTVQQARQVVAGQMMPSPASVRARCARCEYRNFCGDVF
jgi:CRISPR-associated exonuclease Cas4